MRIAREKFIADIAGYVKKYAGLYGISGVLACDRTGSAGIRMG